MLVKLSIPIAFLRAAWFMENSSWDVEPAKAKGILSSFLQPLDKKFPMVATADIGRVAADLLQQEWSGRRIVELEGPDASVPNDIAATFSKLLGRPVRGGGAAGSVGSNLCVTGRGQQRTEDSNVGRIQRGVDSI